MDCYVKRTKSQSRVNSVCPYTGGRERSLCLCGEYMEEDSGKMPNELLVVVASGEEGRM